jgi:hypothetical protein
MEATNPSPRALRIPNQGIGRLVLPLYYGLSKTTFQLAGSGSVYTVAGRFFIVTAAHVADILCKNPIVLRGERQFFSVALQWLRTSGSEHDRVDIAIAEAPAELFAKLGDVVEYVDLSAVTQDFVPKEKMPLAFLGFPQSINKKKVKFHEHPTVSFQQIEHVAFSHPIYREGYFPLFHLCGNFDPKERFTIGSIRVPCHEPTGMSGGLVLRLREDDYANRLRR